MIVKPTNEELKKSISLLRIVTIIPLSCGLIATLYAEFNITVGLLGIGLLIMGCTFKILEILQKIRLEIRLEKN